MTDELLRQHYGQIQQEATRLAGGLTDLSQRAAVYRHLFLESGGNHAFPIIAAHGALWAGSYFRFGMRLGSVLSLLSSRSPRRRIRLHEKLSAFADALRDINRRVCIDTYVNYYFTRRHGRHPEAAQFVDADLLDHLNRLHVARQRGGILSDREKRRTFEAHFLHEQHSVVGPTVATAAEEFDWPLAKAIALRPLIRFAYFPGQTRLWFRNFASREERIEKGLRAFEIAARVGWASVDAGLKRYGVLPPTHFITPARAFRKLRTAVLAEEVDGDPCVVLTGSRAQQVEACG
jgi:hypothetical protein